MANVVERYFRADIGAEIVVLEDGFGNRQVLTLHLFDGGEQCPTCGHARPMKQLNAPDAATAAAIDPTAEPVAPPTPVYSRDIDADVSDALAAMREREAIVQSHLEANGYTLNTGAGVMRKADYGKVTPFPVIVSPPSDETP